MSSAANDEQTYNNEVRLFYHAWLEDYFSKQKSIHPGIKKLVTDFKKKLVEHNYTSGIML